MRGKVGIWDAVCWPFPSLVVQISTGGQEKVNYSGLYNCLTRKCVLKIISCRGSHLFFSASIWQKLPHPPINKGKKVSLVRITHLVQPFRWRSEAPREEMTWLGCSSAELWNCSGSCCFTGQGSASDTSPGRSVVRLFFLHLWFRATGRILA